MVLLQIAALYTPLIPAFSLFFDFLND